MTTSFVHLHLHTEFSLSDGIVRIDELVAATAVQGMPAVAVTDLAPTLISTRRFMDHRLPRFAAHATALA